MVISALPFTALQVFADNYGAGSFESSVNVKRFASDPLGSAEPITLDTPVLATIANGGDYAYFSFTPSASGTYYFESMLDGGDTYGYAYDSDMSEITSDDDSGEGYNCKVSCDLISGNTYYFGVRYYNDSATGSFNVKLTKAPSASSISFTQGTSGNGFVGHSFTLEVEFSPSGSSSEPVTFTSGNDGVASILSSSGNSVTVICNSEGTAAITATSESGLTATYTVTVTDIPVIALDTPTQADIFGGVQTYYSFTPSESGTYFFSSSGNSDTLGYLYDSGLNQISSDDDSGEGNNFKITCELEAGSTYYFAAQLYGAGSGSCTVLLTKASAATAVSFAEGTSGEYFIYDRVNLNAVFSPENCIQESCTFTSDSSIANIVYSSGTYCEVDLIGTGTATITATSENGLTATYTVTVNALPELTLNTPCTFSLSDYNTPVSYTFTPSETGYYYFNNTQGAYVEIYEESSYITYGSGNFSKELYGATTYVIKFSQFNDSNTATISKCVNATGITFENGSSYSGYATTTKTIYANLAPENAIPESVTFSSSNSGIVSVENYYQLETNRFGCDLSLVSAGTATITAESSSGITATYTVTVNAIPELVLDTPLTIDTTDSNGLAVFTPSESGTYRFSFSDYSDGDYFQKGLYDNYDSRIAYAYGNSFSAELTAGTTYKFLAYQGYGTFKATVTKCVAATGITFTTDAGASGYPGDQLTLKAKLNPGNAVHEDITFTSSNDGIVSIQGSYYSDYDDVFECYLDLKASGTATITATSENGLTATYTVVVKSYPALTLDVPYTFNMDGSEGAYVQFTPAVSGQYKFNFSDFSNGYSFYKQLLDASKNYLTYSYGKSIAYDLTAGQTYLIYINSYYGNFKLTVSQSVAATGIEFTTAAGLSDYQYTYQSIYAKLLPDNAIDEQITFTSSDPTKVEIDSTYKNDEGEYGCDLKFKNAGTATITASTVSGLSKTYDVTVLSLPVMALGTPTAVRINNFGEERKFSFTPTETATYIIKSEKYAYKGLYDGFDYITGTNDTSFSYVLEAGKTYVISIGNYSGTNTVVINKAVPATDLQFENSRYNCYVYGQEELIVNFLPENAIGQDVSFTSSNTGVAVVESDGSYSDTQKYVGIKLLKAGTATITATSTGGLTATCTVSVSTPPALTLNTPYQMTSDSYGDNHVVSFRPAQSGGYFFTSDKEGSMSLFREFDYENGGSKKVYAELTAGKTYILHVNDFIGINSVTVTRAVTATALTFDADSYSGYENTSVRLTALFGPDNSAPEKVSFTVSDDTVIDINYTDVDYSGNNYCIINLLAPGTATVTATSTSGLTVTVPVTVNATPVLTLNTPYAVSSNAYGNSFYASFTPSESGYYYFTTAKYSSISLMQGYTTIANASTKLYRYLEAGNTYVVEFSEFTGNNSITVTKAVQATSMAFTADSPTSGYALCYKYLEVAFGPDGSAIEDVTFVSSDPDIAEVNYAYPGESGSGIYNCTLRLLAPGTVTITATSTSGLTDSCTFTVKSIPTIAADTPTQVTITDNEEEFFSFTPSESGDYVIRISDYSNNNEARLSLYDRFDEISSSYDNTINASLTAGTAYTIRTDYRSWYNSTGPNGTYNLTVSKCVPATAVVLSEDSITGYAGIGSDELAVSFEPWNATQEDYTFSSSDDSIVTVDSYGTISFVGEGTATITVTSRNGLTDSCTVTVKPVKTLTLGVGATAEITSGTNADYFTFTAPESAYYVFTSSATGDDTDTYAEIFDENNSLLGEDDDSGFENNFRLRYYMEAGETYIFRASFLGGNTGSFPVIIEKKDVVTGIEILSMPTKTEYIKGCLDDAFDPSGLILRFTWSDSRKTTFVYDRDNNYTLDGIDVSVYASKYNDGNSAELIVSYDGVTAYGALTMVDSPVTSISLAYADFVTIVENTGGYFSSRWDDVQQASVEYYYYFTPSVDDIAVVIHYSDGTTKVGYPENEVDGITLKVSTSQDDAPWTVGGNNYIYITYIDQTVAIPVTITENGVSGIELVTPSSYEFIENTGGYFSSRWDNVNHTTVEYYYYNIYSGLFRDAVVKINYKDGTSRTAHVGDEVDGNFINIIDNQYNNPWTVGGANTIRIQYMGNTCEMPVTVVETPVSSITVTSAPSKVYVFGDGNYGRSYTSGNTTYYEFHPDDLEGLAFTVNYKNGTSKQFTFSDIDPQTGYIDGYSFRLSLDDDVISAPGNVTVHFTYLNVTADYTVSVVENTVDFIQIIYQPNIETTYDNVDVAPYGLTVYVKYTNGTSEYVSFDETNTIYNFRNAAFIGRGGFATEVNGNYMTCRKINTGNGVTYTVEYLGHSDQYDGYMLKTPYLTDINILNFSENAEGLVFEVAYANGESRQYAVDVIEQIDVFADGAAYLVKFNNEIFTVFVGGFYNNQHQLEFNFLDVFGIEAIYRPNAGAIQLGDIDCDGDVDLSDYNVIKNYIAGYGITDSRYDAADINGDGAVDAFDLFDFDRMVNNAYYSKFTFSELSSTTASVSAYSGSDTSIVVPGSYGNYKVTTIAQNAFKAKNTLVNVEIDGNIQIIDNYAFMNCANLENVTFNYGVQRINYGAFLNCTKLESVKIPASVTNIGSNAFKGCTSLKSVSIANGVTAIPNSNAFANCTSLESVIIPESVTNINASTFTGCGSQLTIYGKAGSYAETFANAQGINFVAINF
jgi:uncharacterized protein YjdB